MYDMGYNYIIFFAIIVICLTILIPIMAFEIFCNWKLFKKAGREGWEAIIPFYNQYVLVQIAGLNWWYFLLLLFLGSVSISLSFYDSSVGFSMNIVNIIVNFFIFYNLGKKMHKDPITTGLLGGLFSYIMIPVMALSNDYQYDKDVEVSPNGPINSATNMTSEEREEESARFCTGCGRKLRKNAKFCEHCGKEVQ